ncbi:MULTISPECIES: O-antigen ligase family protein [Bacteroides]|uniref:O-antigen ligase family protein n=1 Tax=Bacteroides TaxID=816 RepID=UPI0018A115B6|nr:MULTISPECIES: O-antigen ligase family protein [Bacteroides]MDC2615285.1 O-antigen ligase family protein [Bacteroides ovatus]MDC2634388.1 O-antigen ligase family protein [Bacteroides ovatus]
MKVIILKRSYVENMIAVLLILLSSGTLCFYHQHSILLCFSLFFYGMYLFIKRKPHLRSVIKNKSFLFVVTYTFWIWINFLVINTNHVEAVTQPYVYCLILWGTFFMTLSMDYGSFKSLLLDLTCVICVISLTLYVLYHIGLISPRLVEGAHGGTFSLLLFDVIKLGHDSNRMCSLWWEPSAFQVVLSMTLFLYIPDMISNLFDKKIFKKILVLILAMILSRSTSGYLGLIIIVLIIVLHNDILKKSKFAFILLFIIASSGVMYIFSSDVIQDKLEEDYGNQNADGSLNVRLFDNLAMIQMISERPLVGYGIDSEDYDMRSLELNNRTSSNGVLALCASFGLPIMFFYVITVFRTLKVKDLHFNNIAACLLFLFFNCFNGMIIHSIVWAVFLDYKKENT